MNFCRLNISARKVFCAIFYLKIRYRLREEFSFKFLIKMFNQGKYRLDFSDLKFNFL